MAATAELEAESRNPFGFHQETKNNVAPKPRSPGPIRSCKMGALSVNKNVMQAAPRTELVWREKKKPSQYSSERPSSGKPSQPINKQTVHNSKQSAPQMKTCMHVTAAPRLASQRDRSQRWQPVENKKVYTLPFKRQFNSKHEVYNHRTVLCGVSAVIHEARELIGQKCWICKDDVANPPADEESEACDLPEVAVLACRHVFHSVCLQCVTQLRDPPCFICTNNLA